MLVHCASMKIQGCCKSHLRAMMKTDAIMNIVDTTRTTLDAMLWPILGERRSKRKATEHFASQIVIK